MPGRPGKRQSEVVDGSAGVRESDAASAVVASPETRWRRGRRSAWRRFATCRLVLQVQQFRRERPGEPGEIVVSGAHVIQGYLHGRGDEETKFKVGGVVPGGSHELENSDREDGQERDEGEATHQQTSAVSGPRPGSDSAALPEARSGAGLFGRPQLVIDPALPHPAFSGAHAAPARRKPPVGYYIFEAARSNPGLGAW